MNDPVWKAHKKHVFILSEAGKPIYTRYVNLSSDCFLDWICPYTGY